ncbi:MAG: DUF1592 domain-containing protein [Pirellulales bacterium]
MASAVMCTVVSAAAAEPVTDGDRRAAEIIRQSCVECHGNREPEGGLDLSEFQGAASLLKNRHAWDKIRQRVHQGDMPPKDSQPLSIDDRQWMPKWIAETYRSQACGGPPNPGPAPLRRLNRNQYSNTIRDLLGVHFDAGHELPTDGAGGEGFDNAAETLFLSPVHGEKYLSAAKQALEYAVRDKEARERLFSLRNKPDTGESDAAREILKRFLSRAFRRPAEDSEVDRYLALYESARKDSLTFEDSLVVSLQGVLISPRFLFLVEPRNESSEAKPIDEHSLASRLSYFLWDTMPDRELRQVADDGRLLDDVELEKQVHRMLKQERLHEMVDGFVGQWLGTRELGKRVKPDPQLFRNMSDDKLAAYREEPVKLFSHVLRENRSLLELIDCNYTFMNDELIGLYRVDRKDLKGDINQNLNRYDLPDTSPRGGLVTMAGVLTVSSYPNRTSPVLRGKWLLETLLGDPPPAPPPGVPPLSDKDQDKQGKTLRQRLEIHRENPACAACHERLDPLGFALENYDAIGRFRKEENGSPIDAEGSLPSGQKIAGSDGVKQLLMERKEQFVRHLVTKMLGYALGRGLVDSDYCVVDTICDDLEQNGYQAQRLVMGIVRSVPFRYRLDRAAEAP